MVFLIGIEPMTENLEGFCSSIWATGTLKSTTILYSYIVLSIVFWNIAHFLHSVKRLKTRSLGRTVCFSQIRSLNCLIYRIISSTSNYVLVTTALIAAKVVPLASSTSQSKRRGFLRPLCIRSTTAGLKEHTQFTINCGPCQGEKFGSPWEYRSLFFRLKIWRPSQ